MQAKVTLFGTTLLHQVVEARRAEPMATSFAIRFLLRCWYYSCLAIGLTAYYYDFSTQSFRTSKLLKWYSVIINALTLLLLPVYYSCGTKYMDNAEPLLIFLSNTTVRVHCVVVVYTIMTRHSKDRRFSRLVQELCYLEDQYFKNPLFGINAPSDGGYNVLFYVKYFMLSLHQLHFIFGLLLAIRVRSLIWTDWVVNLYFVFAWNYLNFMAFSYFITLLYICRRCGSLSVRLKQILCMAEMSSRIDQTVQRSQRKHVFCSDFVRLGEDDLDDLRLLFHIHQRLQCIVVRTNDLFGVHIIALLGMFFVTNLVSFYAAFIHIRELAYGELSLALLAWFLMKCLDILLVCLCCDKVMNNQRKVFNILGEWQQLLVADVETEQECNQFNLHFLMTNFTINIYGMFTLNNRTAFTILLTTLMHVIIIIQFDYLMRE